MKQKCILWLGLLSVLLYMSCDNEVASVRYTPEEFQQKVDSTVAAKVAAIRKEMQDDYQMRKAILLKSIQDSIQGSSQDAPLVDIPEDALTKDENYE